MLGRMRAWCRGWRFALLGAAATILAMIAWMGLYEYRVRVCIDRGTAAACRGVSRLEDWSCDRGVGDSVFVGGCFGVARRHMFGAGALKDDRLAIAFFRRACLSDGGRGCVMTWSNYVDAIDTPHYVMSWGGPTGPMPNDAYLPEWARDLNAVLADANQLCVTDFRDGIVASMKHHELLQSFCRDLPRARAARDDAKAAYPELVALCERHSREACGLSGQILAYGLGVKRDIPRGRDLLSRACSDGYELACKDFTIGHLESAEKLSGAEP